MKLLLILISLFVIPVNAMLLDGCLPWSEQAEVILRESSSYELVDQAERIRNLLAPQYQSTHSMDSETKKKKLSYALKEFRDPKISNSRWSFLFRQILFDSYAKSVLDKPEDSDLRQQAIDTLTSYKYCPKEAKSTIGINEANNHIDMFKYNKTGLINKEPVDALIDLTNHTDENISSQSRCMLLNRFRWLEKNIMKYLLKQNKSYGRDFTLNMSRIELADSIECRLKQIRGFTEWNNGDWYSNSGFNPVEKRCSSLSLNNKRLRRELQWGQDLYKKIYSERTTIMLVRGLLDWDKAS